MKRRVFVRWSSRLAMVVLAGWLGLTLVSPEAVAVTSSDDKEAAELARGAFADTTPAQRHDSARREAYGAFHEAQRECKALRGPALSACQRDAQKQLREDLKAAATPARSAQPE